MLVTSWPGLRVDCSGPVSPQETSHPSFYTKCAGSLFVPNLLIASPELPENWTDTKETLLEGMAFNLKYLGMTMVGQPKGEDMAAAAIRRIVTTVREDELYDGHTSSLCDLRHEQSRWLETNV